MATRLLRKEPSLPAVELYLDDIQEVIEIITKAFKDFGVTSEINFLFKVNEKFECTTVDELQEHGGVAKEFEMVVRSRSYTPLLSTEYFGGLTFRIPYELSESPIAHEVTGQLNRIASDRKVALKTWFREINGNMYVPLLLLVVAVGGGPAYGFIKDNVLKGILLTLQWLACLFFIACAYFVWNKQDRVNLYFKRTDERERIARRKDRLEKIVLLVLGAVLGTVGTLVTQHFKR
jgi:hypothetical protein